MGSRRGLSPVGLERPHWRWHKRGLGSNWAVSAAAAMQQGGPCHYTPLQPTTSHCITASTASLNPMILPCTPRIQHCTLLHPIALTASLNPMIFHCAPQHHCTPHHCTPVASLHPLHHCTSFTTAAHSTHCTPQRLTAPLPGALRCAGLPWSWE